MATDKREEKKPRMVGTAHLPSLEVEHVPDSGLVVVCASRNRGGTTAIIDLLSRLVAARGPWGRACVLSQTERCNRSYTPLLSEAARATSVFDEPATFAPALRALADDQRQALDAHESTLPRVVLPPLTRACAGRLTQTPLLALVAAYLAQPAPVRCVVVCDDVVDLRRLLLPDLLGEARRLQTLYLVKVQYLLDVPPAARGPWGVDLLLAAGENNERARRVLYDGFFCRTGTSSTPWGDFVHDFDAATADFGFLAHDARSNAVKRFRAQRARAHDALRIC